MSDPSKVVISLIDDLMDDLSVPLYRRDPETGVIEASEGFAADAVVYEFGLRGKTGSEAAAYILDKLESHMNQHGHVEEFTLLAHGTTNIMGINALPPSEQEEINTAGFKFSTQRFLSDMRDRFPGKYPDRIMFHGCKAFSGLTPEDEEFYIEFSKETGTEIVGSTTPTVPFPGDSGGHFYVIKPDGNVEFDRAYVPSLAAFFVSLRFGNGNDWTYKHLYGQQYSPESLREMQHNVLAEYAGFPEKTTFEGKKMDFFEALQKPEIFDQLYAHYERTGEEQALRTLDKFRDLEFAHNKARAIEDAQFDTRHAVEDNLLEDRVSSMSGPSGQRTPFS